MNESNNTPQLTTPREQMLEEIRPYLLDPREDYSEPYTMLEYNGVPFSTIGGIQAITGQKKNGKSFVLTQLMAAVLGSGSERIEENLPGLKVPDRTLKWLGHEPRVLYVDTEMDKLHSAKVMRRVHWLCGWEFKETQERFHVLWVKTMQRDEVTGEERWQKRRRYIKYAIEVLNPDIVFIDGLRDIVASINEEQPILDLLEDFGTLAEQRKICIWMALHYNPRPGNDTASKMRGWAGTELGNKVSDTLVSSKDKKNGHVTFTVTQEDARDKDLDDWRYEITEQAGKLGVPHIIGNAGDSSRVKPDADSVDDIRSWIHESELRYTWPMSRKDIKKLVFGEIGGVKNDGRQQADLRNGRHRETAAGRP